MQETMIKYFEKPKLKNPILIEGLPGIGNVGRVGAGYIVNELKAKKFAELYSQHFLPLVVLQKNGVARMLKSEFFYYKGKQDLIMVIGDSQSITPHGYYDLCERILDLAEEFNVKQIITLGGLGVEEVSKKPNVVGAVNDEKLLKKFKNYDIKFDGTLVGTIIGVSGLLIGLAKARDIDGLCLMVETPGFPIVITDPIAADTLLRLLSKILDIKIDMNRLENEVMELEKRIKKTEEIHKKMITSLESEKKEHLKYIG